ncbi:MAG: ATP-binding protein [Clostridia bacterium]|nr:ATP-binding protein [Clostridia bacterium]
MFKSLKTSIKVLLVVVVIVTTLAMQLLVSYSLTGEYKLVFNTPTIITIGVLVIITLIMGNSIATSVTLPIKKLERSIKNLAEGKSIDTKNLKNITKPKEIQGLISHYDLMIDAILKKNFDLNSQESKTQIILERMDDGVIAFSLQKEVIHANTAAKNFIGITDSDNTYEKVCRKLGMKVDFDKIVYLSNYKNIEEKIVREDNVLSVVLVPFHDRLIPMGVIMIIKNITESEKLNNMRKEFVANVSHELKTPLSSIKGYSETIIDRDLSHNEIIKFATVINTEANRMDRIVADLLQLSRFDYNKNIMNKIKFNLDDLAKQVVENMQYVAREKNHNLKCVVNMIPPPIYADKDSIQQVIINILSNSIKYTADGGEITVYIGSAGNKAYMKFVDNGIGIPEKDLKRIFERFYRVDKARSRSMGGTGLGLSIVKEIVESHDGTIDIKSEPGVGTEVIVTLPTIK